MAAGQQGYYDERRRKQLWAELTQARRQWLKQAPVLVEVSNADVRRVEVHDFEGLPRGVELAPGSITVRFSTPDEALEKAAGAGHGCQPEPPGVRETGDASWHPVCARSGIPGLIQDGSERAPMPPRSAAERLLDHLHLSSDPPERTELLTLVSFLAKRHQKENMNANGGRAVERRVAIVSELNDIRVLPTL
jgi:hypothetical protein